MSAPAHRAQFIIDDFTVLEGHSNVKHEFLDGEIRAMGGGTREHGAIAANVIGMLAAALRDRPRQAHTSDVRVRVVETGLDTYPDASVVCTPVELDRQDRLAVVNPVLLVEVTSPSSEAYDRGEKLDHHKRIPSLRSVPVVSHPERHVELWRRDDQQVWHLETYSADDTVVIADPGCELPVVARIHERESRPEAARGPPCRGIVTRTASGRSWPPRSRVSG